MTDFDFLLAGWHFLYKQGRNYSSVVQITQPFICYFVMLCYVMLCYVMSCYVMLRHCRSDHITFKFWYINFPRLLVIYNIKTSYHTEIRIRTESCLAVIICRFSRTRKVGCCNIKHYVLNLTLHAWHISIAWWGNIFKILLNMLSLHLVIFNTMPIIEWQRIHLRLLLYWEWAGNFYWFFKCSCAYFKVPMLHNINKIKK